MINTFEIYQELKAKFDVESAEALTRILSKIYEDIQNTVTRQDFSQLQEVVKDLAEAQKRTEERLNELAEAQKRTEERLNELAEAQKRTEEELRKLVGEHKKTREQVGSLSHTVGYVLEDRAYKGLPELLKRDFGIQIVDGLKRDYIKIGMDKYEEINIIGKGRGDGKDVWVIGECKSQLKKVNVDDFLKAVKKIEPFVKGERVLVAVTYQASPSVREYVEQKGIKLYFSFEMPLN